MKTKLILDVNKTQYAQLNSIVTGRVGDKVSNIVDVYVIDGGIPYNLTGLKVFFECAKPDNTVIRDDNGVKMIDAAKGYFEYTFPPETFGAVGKAKQAFMSIEKDKTIRATTQDFVLITLPDATTNRIPSESYFSDLEKLIQELNEMALEEINSQAAAEASAAKDFANQANELSISIQNQLNEIVINGDSSVEAAQARVDDKGVVYPYLKARLDVDSSQIKILSKPRTFIGEKFPVYISHNGFNYIAPINCLPAYELAAEAGHKYFEVDIRTTKDNVWMAFHDDDVTAMTDGTGLFKDKTLIEAKALTVDTMLTTYPGTKIPTFEEFLGFCTKWNATPVIEVKVYNNDTNLSDLITILKDTGYLNKCIVMAFGMGTLTKLRGLNKDMALCLLSNTADQVDLDNAKSIDSDYVSVNKSVITKNFCQLAHNNGLKVGAWTTDSEEEARNLTTLGVDIITTNSLLPRGV